MKVSFENVLVCDVATYEYKEEKYDKLVVYDKGQLYQIGIPSSMVNDCKSMIAKRSSFNTEMTSFNGKNKFKLVQNDNN